MSALAAERSPEKTYDFDIPRTSRIEALRALSQQGGGIQLTYLSSDTGDSTALVGPIEGKLTVAEALREILRSSALTHRWAQPNELIVEPGWSSKPRAEVGPQDEVVVTSWPLHDLAYSVAPVQIIERNEIDALGAPTLPDLLRYLSKNAYVRSESHRMSGAQYAEMRGLGTSALVLINGRRALPSANSITSDEFDLNTIPIVAVERLEVLSNSAAAAFGTDATEGILNIVLRRKVAKPTVELRYGGADDGAEQRRATLSLGTDGARFDSALILDHFQLGGVLGAERDRWRNQDYRRFGGRDQRSLASPTGNITSVLGADLPGLGAPVAAVPLVDRTPGIGLDDFLATAGSSNRESLFAYWSVVPEGARTSLVGNASFDINERLTVSGEVLYVDRQSTFHFYPGGLFGALVPATNPHNPFDTPVLAHRLLPELGAQSQHVDSQLLRSVLALHGRLGNWDWSISALQSEEQASSWIANELDQGAVARALASSDPALALNPFQSGPIASTSVLQSLRAPRDLDDFASIGRQVMAYGAGPVLRTAAGDVRMSLGGEWRRESSVFQGDDAGLLDRDRDITAAFATLRVPLIGKEMNVPAIRELSLTAGTRLDSYKGMGRVVRSQYELQWQPHSFVTLYATTGHSFRPPSLYELYFPEVDTLASAVDPTRMNEPTNVAVLMGGNPDLKPSLAKTTTAGFTFAPQSALNWNVSADYWRMAMDSRVTTLPLAVLLANESLFPHRVLRARPTEADLSAGVPGALRAVDSSRINVGGVQASGVDFGLSSDFFTSLGRFTPRLRATWFDSFRAADIPGQPMVDRVNVASEFGSILRWRMIASLRWTLGPYAITPLVRYTPGYDDAVAGVRTGRSVSAQTLVDLQCSWDLDRMLGPGSAWRGFKLSAGAFNLFDAEPGFAEVGGASDFDVSQGSPQSRSYYLRVQKEF